MPSPRPQRLLALCLLLAGAPGGLRPAHAQEEGGSDPAEEGGDPAGAEGEEPSTEQAQNIVDSAKELQDKLGQLKALLAKKGDDVDPTLKERLAGLEKQLEGLDLAGVSGGGASSELNEFLGGCIMMSMRRAGTRKPKTLSALRSLASGKLTKEDAVGMDLVRMISVCVTELTDQEFSQYKAGQLQQLPQPLAAKAADPASRDMVLGIEADVWQQLGPVAAALQTQIVGDVDASRGLPAGTGLIAGIPLVLIFAFLAKKFYEMKQRESEKTDKKKERKGK